MFLSQTENSIPCYLLIRMLMILNVMKVLLVTTKEVDSINFKNAIIQLQQLPFELPEFEKDIKEMIIESGYGNTYLGDLVIENYPNLEEIFVYEWSLQNLNSLKICNCEKLKTIEIEDGEWKDGSFNYVKNVIIESI